MRKRGRVGKVEGLRCEGEKRRAKGGKKEGGLRVGNG